nr:zinc finger, CCHC-type [Tanacetum cinerariifolium]
MGDENPIRTLGDNSKPSPEGYKNTIDLPVRNNVVPLRSDTIRLVQNECSFYGLRSKDPNQHLRDFLKLVDSLDLDSENKERTHMRLFQYSLRDQASNWLERLPVGSTATWEDLTTHPKQAFVEYASSRTDEAGGLVSNFMASQVARLTKFETDFKQQQSKMTNKIDIVLKAITDRMAGALPSDMVKNQKLRSKHFLNKPATNRDGDRNTTTRKPEPTLEDEFQDLHLNLPVLEVLVHAPIYNAILDKYIESLELGKNGSVFVKGEVPTKMEDPRLFRLPCRLGDSKPFDTLVDLGSRNPETPLLVERGFLATANAVIDCRMAKIAIGEGITSSVFGVKGVNLGEEQAPYWTTLGKRESYKQQPSLDGVGARTPYYARKDFLYCHLPGE